MGLKTQDALGCRQLVDMRLCDGLKAPPDMIRRLTSKVTMPGDDSLPHLTFLETHRKLASN